MVLCQAQREPARQRGSGRAAALVRAEPARAWAQAKARGSQKEKEIGLRRRHGTGTRVGRRGKSFI